MPCRPRVAHELASAVLCIVTLTKIDACCCIFLPDLVSRFEPHNALPLITPRATRPQLPVAPAI